MGLETTDIRKESMLAPYAFWMGENLRSGMRHDSPLYIFFNKDALAELIRKREVSFYLTARGSLITPDAIPYSCIECVVAKGIDPTGAGDELVYHTLVADWPFPVAVTKQGEVDWQHWKSSGQVPNKVFNVAIEWWEDQKKDSIFYCPCCYAPMRRGLTRCLNCWCPYLFRYAPWARTMVDPIERAPTEEEINEAAPWLGTAGGMLESQMRIIQKRLGWVPTPIVPLRPEEGAPLRAVIAASPASSGPGGCAGLYGATS
jgi:hypothetical protein